MSMLMEKGLVMETRKSSQLSKFNTAEMLADDEEWDIQFSASLDALEQLANEALAEHHAGKTLPLDPDQLYSSTDFKRISG